MIEAGHHRRGLAKVAAQMERHDVQVNFDSSSMIWPVPSADPSSTRTSSYGCSQSPSASSNSRYSWPADSASLYSGTITETRTARRLGSSQRQVRFPARRFGSSSAFLFENRGLAGAAKICK